MKDNVFRAIAFIENGDVKNGRYFYDMTLAEAIEKMKLGLKYALTEKGFEWVSVNPVDPIKNIKMNISVYYSL